MIERIPNAAGVSLKPCHFAEIHGAPGRAAWFEVHAENCFMAGGPPHRHLTAIRENHPLSIHGVGLSLGGLRRPEQDHLLKLRTLIGRYQPGLVSEHLAWCEMDGAYFNDLLPVPYDEATLERVAGHIAETQDVLGRSILIENPSRYVALPGTMSEGAFISELCRRTGCGLLLDVNNVYVSASNLGEDPGRALAAMPFAAVRQFHLAGHSISHSPAGEFRIDDHGSPVCGGVWALFDEALAHTGPLPTLIEWDNAVPPFDRLLREAARAQSHLDGHFREWSDGNHRAVRVA
jgi:uncharacterized protein (UPF0276 family)